MQRDLCAYLYDVTSSVDLLRRFTANSTLESFLEDELLRSAVERKFEVIGEALSQAAKYFPGSIDSIPDVSLIVGQRNWLAHGYFSIDPTKLWTTLKNDLDGLREAAKKLMDERCPPL